MTDLPSRLKQLRKEHNLLQKDIAEKLNITPSAYGYYEQGKRTPDSNTLNVLAGLFNVSTDYLLCRVNDRKKDCNFTPEITVKDEKDIAKELERVMSSLDSENGLMLYNNEIDDETRELLRASLESTIREAKLIAKLKYTPKKYRK